MQATAKKRRHLQKFMIKIFLHATLLKSVLPFSEEFQCGLVAEIYYEYSWQLFQLLDKKMEVVLLNFRYKFYRNFFLIMTRDFSFCRYFEFIFFKNIWKLTSSLIPCNVEKHTFAILLTFITWCVCIVEKKISCLYALKQLPVVFKKRN